MGALDRFPKEVKLLCSNHVFNVGNVVEDVPNCGVLYPLLFHMCYVDGLGYAGCFDAKRLQACQEGFATVTTFYNPIAAN